MSVQQKIVTLLLNKLEAEKDALKLQWQEEGESASRHFVLDNVLPAEMCQTIYAAFPQKGEGFYTRHSFREKKRTSAHLNQYPSILAEVTYAFQNQAVVESVADITQLTSLVPDPALYAGGLSMMFHGDFLNPHIDNSHNMNRTLYRRLNLLYYVSPNWTLDKGGHLELWDRNCYHPKTIVSACNRLVVMETHKKSWHSVNKVLTDEPRCCVSNYYFSMYSPQNKPYFHVTSFLGRPEEKCKRVVGVVDNLLRNTVAHVFKMGRGKYQSNQDIHTTMDK